MIRYYLYDKSDALHLIVEARTELARDLAMKAAVRLLGDQYKVVKDDDMEGIPTYEVRYSGGIEER